MSDYVSEAGHWYTKSGSPAYEQIVKSGKRKGELRATTLRDARKLGLVPSVTTICGILDKPALTHWRIKEAVAKALAEERGIDYFEDDSAEVGSRIHGAIEDWIATGTVDEEYTQYARICKDVFTLLKVYNPVSERSFAANGYGGAVDLHDEDANVIIDFKTKNLSLEDVEKGKNLAYDEHCMQLAAYRMGLGMSGAKCYNLFLSRTEPEAYVLHKWSEEELDRGAKMFITLHEMWKLTKRFD